SPARPRLPSFPTRRSSDLRARLAAESRDGLRVRERVREQKLDRDGLIELEMTRRDDEAHSALSEDTVDAVLAGEHFAFANGNGQDRKSTRLNSSHVAISYA